MLFLVESQLTEDAGTPVQFHTINDRSGSAGLHSRRITGLYQGVLTAGTHVFEWEAGDRPSAIYLIKMDAGRHTRMVKCLLVR